MDKLEEEVRQVIASIRFPKGLCCIRCGKKNIYELSHKQFKCKSCKKRFRLLTDTKLENMKVSLLEFIEIISCFINNVQPKTIQERANLRSQTVYDYLRIIRGATINSLSEKEKAVILEDKVKVFCIVEDDENVSCKPLLNISEKELQKRLKSKEAPYEEGAEFITQRHLYRCVDDATPSRMGIQIQECSGFYNYFQNEHEHTLSNYNTKNFSLHLKAIEYLYNRKKQGDSEVEIVKDIIRRILES